MALALWDTQRDWVIYLVWSSYEQNWEILKRYAIKWSLRGEVDS